MSRRTLAEFLGTALLVMAVVGSGIMAESLAGGQLGIFDYYKLRNLQADTEMRRALSSPAATPSATGS